MDGAPEGFDAVRAWRQVPRETRRAYSAGTGADPDHAWAALGYARLALSGLGFLIYIGPAVLVLAGFSIAMSLLDIGPDGFDLTIFGALLVFIAFNHVRTATRIRDAANRALGPRLG